MDSARISGIERELQRLNAQIEEWRREERARRDKEEEDKRNRSAWRFNVYFFCCVALSVFLLGMILGATLK